MEEIMLSFCLVTYNHEKYILECLESIFKQKVNFKMEILVGNDCSQDATAQLIKDNYGDRVNLIDRKENLGLCKNLYDLFLRAKGRYVYMFSGDDYIKDEYMLQKQVDFLEEHPEYFSASARNLNYNQAKDSFSESGIDFGDYTIVDFFMDGKIPCIYGTMRNVFAKDQANNYFLPLGAQNNEEVKMWLYTMDQGKKYIFEDYMTVYRFVNQKGASNYFSNMTYLKLFTDYYQDILMLEPVYGKKYNLKPYKMITMNKYCNLMSDSIKSFFTFMRTLKLGDAISLIAYKLYLKTHHYQVPAKWYTEEYIVKQH